MTLPLFAAEARARVDAGYYRVRAAATSTTSFRDAVAAGPGVVAEVKPASPTAGALRAGSVEQNARLAQKLADAGALALSILTIPDRFGGSLELLARASHVDVPVLMKDFLVHESQLDAARASGASAVLLIPDILGDWDVHDAIRAAHDRDLDVLYETYDAKGFEAAQRTDADILAVNNRDLRADGLPIDPVRFVTVMRDVGKDRPTMSLSGCKTRADVEAQVMAGADAVLMGTALMRADDPVAALRRVTGR